MLAYFNWNFSSTEGRFNNSNNKNKKSQDKLLQWTHLSFEQDYNIVYRGSVRSDILILTELL